MKYKVSAKIQFEIETEPTADGMVAASEYLAKTLPAHLTYRGLSVSKVKSKQMTNVLGVFKPEDVLPFIGERRHEFTLGAKKYFVKMMSHRYHVFTKSMVCCSCGLEGKYFFLENHKNNGADSYHFNLYAEENGDYVLMTRDHILAKAAGGIDIFENYQVMCCVCNNLKQADPLTPTQVMELRKIYNEYRKGFTRKEVAAIIEAKRKEMLAVAVVPKYNTANG